MRIFLKFQTKFDKDAVRDIIRYAIKENVGTSQQYDAKLITTWSNELMEACLVALTKLQKPFKYIGMILKYMYFVKTAMPFTSWKVVIEGMACQLPSS
jgi:hypothetical protein